MERSRSWFVALYGSIFASLFGIVFIIMVVYRANGYAYFPDWDSFVAGYDSALRGGGYGDFLKFFQSTFHWLSQTMQNLLSFGHFGQDGIFTTLFSIWAIVQVGPILFLGGLMATLGVAYVFFLTVPLLASVTFALGATITNHNISGSVPPVEYWTGAFGYPTSEWSWSVVTVPVVS